MMFFLQIDPLTSLITGELLKQGPVIFVLALIIWYFYKNQQEAAADFKALREKHEADIKANSEKLENYILQDRERLLTVIENNTNAMQEHNKITRILEEYLEKNKP